MTSATDSTSTKTRTSEFDLRISRTIIDFAQALRAKYNLEYARCMEQSRQLTKVYKIDPDDDDAFNKNPDYHAEARELMGEGNGILQCIIILNEFIDAEIKDRKQYSLESKN